MKVEYSYFGDGASLIIKGTDFLKALKDKEEQYLLEVAVDGFCAKFDVTTHFSDEVNAVIAHWLGKTGDVIYTIKERWLGSRRTDTWCEVYIENGHRITEVVISRDNGRSFSLRREE